MHSIIIKYLITILIITEVPGLIKENKSWSEGFSIIEPSFPMLIWVINISPAFSYRVICDSRSLTLSFLGKRKSS
jgi:hypothetical protein